MNKLINYFENIEKNDKLVQSFLIGNVSYETVKDSLTEIISKYIFNKSISIENNPDIYVLRDNENSISKSDIKNLINNLSTTSQFNKNKIYIIENFELLNINSNNALLKILEEPQPGIYAFLITQNIDAVLPTISSRCQKIFLNSNIEKIYNSENIEIANSLIESIEKNNVKSIAKNNELYSIISDRSQLIEVLQIVFNKYETSLKLLINNNVDDNIITKNNNVKIISKKLIIINNNINRLNNNTNKNLSIDRFIIEMWRCSL